MENMFCNCKNLEELDLSDFNTDNVTNTKSMFENCISLEKINMHDFEPANLNDMENMFRGCENLKELYNFYACNCNVKSASHMFFNCINLKECPIIEFTNCKDMSSMFENYSSLTRVYIPIYGEDGNEILIDNMSYMFSGCKNLEDAYVITNESDFVLKKADYLFYNCKK
jgi:surface protein